MRILLADDHAVFRRGLKTVLLEHYPHAEFGEAGDATGTLEAVSKDSWDVLILDISMPGRNGVEVLREIQKFRPQLPILILSVHSEDHYAVRALAAGAAGYLTKLNQPEEILQAVDQVLAGQRYISPRAAEHLLNYLREGEGNPEEQLSNREFQILRMIAGGNTVKSIAAELSVSPQTVSTHRGRILKKMGLNTTSDLIRYALEHRLLD